MGITKEGIQGEKKLFEFLRNRGFKFFQADAIGSLEGEYYLFEAKHQERYDPPPFEGHGLPKWQVEARIKFQEETGVIAWFVVFEKGTNNVFYQRLDVLEKTKYFDTKGDSPRRVYSIKHFKQC
jgi:hypothetical protein